MYRWKHTTKDSIYEAGITGEYGSRNITKTVGCRRRNEWMDLALPAMTGSFASYDGYWKAYGR